MTTTECPACREAVRVPSQASPAARVRCRWCREEFRLEEVLEHLPPELEVLEDPGVEDLGVEGASPWAAIGAAGETAEAPESADDAPAFQLETRSPVRAPSGHEVRRAGRRRKNPRIELVKIVLGGLVALPLAQLILWWLPGKWQRDPLDLGPDVARYASWVVPENLHGAAAADDDDSATEAPTGDRRGRPMDDRGDGRILRPPPDRGGNDRGHVNIRVAWDEGQRADGELRVNGTERPLPASGPIELALPAGLITVELIRPGFEPGFYSNSVRAGDDWTIEPEWKPEYDPEAVGEGDATSERVPVGVRGARVHSPQEFREALDAALEANRRWDLAQEAGADADEAALYAAFARVGEVVTFIDPEDQANHPLLEELVGMMDQIAQQPRKLARIGNLASDWWSDSERTSQGILLYGTVQGFRSRGALYETGVELAAMGDPPTVPVVQRFNPLLFYTPGARVLFLGTIVADPPRQLAGYRGDEPQVVMDGFRFEVIPTESP